MLAQQGLVREAREGRRHLAAPRSRRPERAGRTSRHLDRLGQLEREQLADELPGGVGRQGANVARRRRVGAARQRGRQVDAEEPLEARRLRRLRLRSGSCEGAQGLP